MVKTPWEKSAKKISRVMRKDLVEIFVSDPIKDEVGEELDSIGTSLGIFRANITTPQEGILEEERGTIRPHYYQITLDVDVALPQDKKLFIKIVKTRQGVVDSILEVKSLVGGLLGQTIDAEEESY